MTFRRQCHSASTVSCAQAHRPRSASSQFGLVQRIENLHRDQRRSETMMGNNFAATLRIIWEMVLRLVNQKTFKNPTCETSRATWRLDQLD